MSDTSILRTIGLLGCAVGIAGAMTIGLGHPTAAAAAEAEPPRLLRDTGLYAPGSTTEVRATNLPFTPQYPLWSDGTSKRRWLYLPPGTFIDASRPDSWDFPRGNYTGRVAGATRQSAGRYKS